jgi:N-acetylmuramoyl-L-alanine amidase
MRALVVLLLLCHGLACLQGGEVKKGPAPLRLSGQEYVNVQDWAEANHLVCTRKGDELRLTNRVAQLTLKINAQRVELNGVTLFLAYPVVLHQGAAWIAQKDTDLSLRPLLFPAKNPPKKKVKTVALSAGHGGKDCGYQLGSEQEKEYTLLLARAVQKLAKRAGLKTVLVRSADEFVALEDRPRLAKRGQADCFLELHYNCAGPGDTETDGVEVYCLTPTGAASTNGGADSYPRPLPGNRNDERNILLAYQLQRSLVEKLALPDRGVRRARFVVLREAEMPAVLIEAGFMSRPDQMRRIQDPEHRRRTAQALLDGVLAYKKAIER